MRGVIICLFSNIRLRGFISHKLKSLLPTEVRSEKAWRSTIWLA